MRIDFLRINLALAAFTVGINATAAPTVSPWTDAGPPQTAEVAMGGRDAQRLLVRREGADPMRSIDGGLTWTAFTVQGTRPDRFVPSPVNPNLFYAQRAAFLNGGAGSTALPGSLHRSIDGGLSWTLIRESLAAGGGPLGNLRLGAAPNLLYAARMVPGLCFINCNYVGEQAFRSVDGGSSWLSIHAGLSGGDLILAPATSDPAVVYAATSSGIYRSGDQGSSWNRIRTWNEGDISGMEQIVVDSADANTLYAKLAGTDLLWVTEDGGASWREARFHVAGPQRLIVADPVAAGRLYLLSTDGEVAESRDRARTWARVAPITPKVIVADEYARGELARVAIGLLGDARVAYMMYAPGALRRAQIRQDALYLGSDMWWNPAESGAGWSISQHDSGQVFAVWYDYDADGRQTWRVIPEGTWTDSRTFTGPLYTTTGPHFFQMPFDPSKVVATQVGSASFRFDDSENGVFSYTVSGISGEKSITRQLFGNPVHDRFHPQNYADLWWNPLESGWGFAFSQQYSTAFAVLFIYDEQGRPIWVTMPDGRLGWETIGQQGVWNFFGDIYTTTGPRFGQPFDPAQVTVTRVGAASVAFVDRETARLSYDAFGRQATRPLVRQSF